MSYGFDVSMFFGIKMNLTVVGVSTTNCFINLPRSVIQLIDLDNLVPLVATENSLLTLEQNSGRALVYLVWGSSGNNKLILAWSGDTSATPDTVEVRRH